MVAEPSIVPLPPRRGWIPRTEDAPSATETMKSAGRLSVDGKDLKAVGDYLSELGTATRAIMREVAKADAAASLNGVRYCSLGDDRVGNVVDMRMAFIATTRQLDTDLGNIATSLEHTATAMAKIAKQYRNADERNRLDAETVKTFLKGPSRG